MEHVTEERKKIETKLNVQTQYAPYNKNNNISIYEKILTTKVYFYKNFLFITCTSVHCLFTINYFFKAVYVPRLVLIFAFFAPYFCDYFFYNRRAKCI